MRKTESNKFGTILNANEEPLALCYANTREEVHSVPLFLAYQTNLPQERGKFMRAEKVNVTKDKRWIFFWFQWVFFFLVVSFTI